uniref:Uncharacterized protein n=2 Tax=Anguilla anguilla TaxID=7936 RepID=A0A0E9S0D8_ANGAN
MVSDRNMLANILRTELQIHKSSFILGSHSLICIFIYSSFIHQHGGRFHLSPLREL